MQVHTPTRPLASFLSQLHTHHTLILEIIHINDPRSNENYYLNKTTTSNCFESSLLGQRQSIMDSSKSSLTLHGEEMMEAMRRQQELVMQLRALVLPLLLHGAVHADTTSAADIAAPLFDDVIACNITVSSKLHQWCLMSSGGGAGAGNMVDDDDELVDDKSLVRKSDSTSKQHLLLHSSGDRTEKQAANKPSVGQKRRRNDKRSRSLVTHVPHYDGHQWRKYGQKNINGRQHPRNYYRCAYRSERNCLATKTIEQQNASSTSSAMAGEENAKYNVVYYGDHTCKDHNVSMVQQAPQHVNMDLQNGEVAQTTTHVQEPDSDLDLAALLEVFESSLINWDEDAIYSLSP